MEVLVLLYQDNFITAWETGFLSERDFDDESAGKAERNKSDLVGGVVRRFW